jgi:hypothetical protein
LITIWAPLFEWVPGVDHPDTLMPQDKLAMSCLAAGRTAKAIRLFKRTLADCERVLRACHRDTLTSRNNLAMSYWAAGRTVEAILLLERSLADCERVLGAAHPNTKAARKDLAALTGEPEGTGK